MRIESSLAQVAQPPVSPSLASACDNRAERRPQRRRRTPYLRRSRGAQRLDRDRNRAAPYFYDLAALGSRRNDRWSERNRRTANRARAGSRPRSWQNLGRTSMKMRQSLAIAFLTAVLAAAFSVATGRPIVGIVSRAPRRACLFRFVTRPFVHRCAFQLPESHNEFLQPLILRSHRSAVAAARRGRRDACRSSAA